MSKKHRKTQEKAKKHQKPNIDQSVYSDDPTETQDNDTEEDLALLDDIPF